MTTGSRKIGRPAHFFFRLKLVACGDTFRSKQGELDEPGLCGWPRAEVRFLPLTVISLTQIGVEP